jgi:DNA-binding IclR family transcriptional regulator
LGNHIRTGKALLAELPLEELHELFPKEQLPAVSPRTSTTHQELERKLQLVRERGYATNNDESDPSVSAVATVIRDSMKRPRAAISVAAPTTRLSEEFVFSIVEALMRTTRKRPGSCQVEKGSYQVFSLTQGLKGQFQLT